jgi:DNA-binding response OmpR family regulator
MAQATGKKRILIVEDDAIINSMYKTKLELDGFEALSASNGSIGLELAKKEKIDLILLDVIMPQIDGFTVLTELKKDAKTKNIPVVMLTNLSTEEDKVKGEKLGAVDYVVKSGLTPAQVSEKVQEYLK